MPVLKTLKNGVWVPVSGMSEHTHTKDDITNFPASLPADGGNADTLEGKHANEFATVSTVKLVSDLVGDIKVSEQIASAVAEKSKVQIITWEAND